MNIICIHNILYPKNIASIPFIHKNLIFHQPLPLNERLRLPSEADNDRRRLNKSKGSRDAEQAASVKDINADLQNYRRSGGRGLLQKRKIIRFTKNFLI